jgi:hypothetical protein
MSLNLTSRRPNGGSLNVAFSSTMGFVGPLPSGSQSVTIYCSVAGFVRVAYGTTQTTATASDIPIPANVPVVVPVPQRSVSDASGADKIWVAAKSTTITSAGTMYAQPNAD